MTFYVGSGIVAHEEFSTVDESMTLDRWEASVTLRLPWADRHLAAADVLSNRREWPHGGPTFGVKPRANSVSWVPDETRYAAAGQIIFYEDALFTINYSSAEETDLVAESLEPSAEFITLDHREFRWSSDDGEPLLEAEAPGRLQRGLTIVRTLYHLTSIPTVVATGIGKVNHATYTSGILGLIFQPETLLYTPPTISRTITTGGTKGWNLTVRFMYKPEGWNKFWRAKTNAFAEIYNKKTTAGPGGRYRNYPLGNFSSILF